MSRALITGDSQLTRRILRGILEAAGHEVMEETARKECMRMGALDFLNKPPNDDESNAAVEKALAFKEERPS